MSGSRNTDVDSSFAELVSTLRMEDREGEVRQSEERSDKLATKLQAVGETCAHSYFPTRRSCSETNTKILTYHSNNFRDSHRLSQGEDKETADTSTNWREKTLLPSSCDPTLLDDNVANLITPVLERHKSYPMSLEYFTSLVMMELDRVGLESLDIVRTLRNRARNNRARAKEIAKSSDKKGKGKQKLKNTTSAIINMFHPSINNKSKELGEIGRGAKRRPYTATAQ